MSAKSTFLAEMVHNTIKTKGRWFSLHTAHPGARGNHEVAKREYHRVPIVFTDGEPGGFVLNAKEVVSATPGPDTFDEIHYGGVWDADKGGNFLFAVACAHPVRTSAGVPLSFPAGALRYEEPRAQEATPARRGGMGS